MSDAAAGGGAGTTVVVAMVVDDDRDIRETVAEVLEDEGYTVVTAENGADALALLERVRPQVILLDLSMPVMSGEQFRQRQLADPALAAIPTVVMSATDRIHEKTRALQLHGTIPKPVDLEVLVSTVARCVTAGGAPPAHFGSPPAR